MMTRKDIVIQCFHMAIPEKPKLIPGQTNITQSIVYIIILTLLRVYIRWFAGSFFITFFYYFQILKAQRNLLTLCTGDSSIKIWYLGTAESFVLTFSIIDTTIKFWSLDRVIMKLIQPQKIFYITLCH